jgi:hypothetical protein
LCISTLEKKMKNNQLILVILYVKCSFFPVAHGFQLDNGVTSPGMNERYVHMQKRLLS